MKANIIGSVHIHITLSTSYYCAMSAKKGRDVGGAYNKSNVFKRLGHYNKTFYYYYNCM